MRRPQLETKTILLVGDTKVGKSALLYRWVDDCFSDAHTSTIGIDFRVTVTNGRFKLHIWDTAGQERHKASTTFYYRNLNAIVVVFDVTNRESFKNLSAHKQEIKKNTPSDPDNPIPIILLGNKTDLESERKVSLEEAQNFAADNGWIYIEASAKTGHNVKKLESKLLDRLQLKAKKQPLPTGMDVDQSSKKTLLLESIDGFIALHPDNQPVQRLYSWLKVCLNSTDPKTQLQTDVEKALQMKEFKADLNSLWWTSRSIFNSFINLAITVLLTVSIVGFPIAYLSGLLEKNKQETGHSCMFFHFGEYQATKAKCNEVFAEVGVSCRV